MSRFLKPLGWFGMSGLLLLVLSGTARADTVVFNTCGTGGSSGACSSGAKTFTSSAGTITLTPFGTFATGAPANLFAKNNAGDEVGMGLTNDPTSNFTEDEITAGSFIQIMIPSSLIGEQLTIQMGSTTDGEEWKIYEATTSGATSGTGNFTGFGEGGADPLVFTPGAGDLYIDVTSLDGNVLLRSLSFTAPTPEPSGLALLGTGILGLAGVVRRKLKV